MTRREFLTACALAPSLTRQTSGDRFIESLPLGNPNGGPTTPLGRLLGSGLDARLFTDLSTIDLRDPATLVTPNDRFYIRTAAPATADSIVDHAAVARAVQRATGLDWAPLERLAVRAGPYVLECAGNADPANFGLISAASWEGIPLPAVLDRLAKPPTSSARVFVSGLDDPGPSRTSVPGASWIFSRDQLERALLAIGMNAAPLPRHHGSPVRLFVPGWYGCACIKWVDAVRFVPDTAPATSQMQEFATRTHQPFAAGSPPAGSRPARDYEPATIDTSAFPIRIEKWVANGRLEYRIAGILWGGTKPTNALSIRFRAGTPWRKVEHCPLPASTLTWSTWTHTWQPQEPGRYQIVLRIDDPGIRTRRLDLFYYVREVDIREV